MSRAARSRMVTDAVAIIVIIAGLAYIVLGAGPGGRRVRLPTVEVAIGPGGRPVARIDDALLQAACRDAGLPDPPALDGADPIPVRLLLEAIGTWTATGGVEALGRLGHMYQALEEHQAALECFAALVRLDPDEPRWVYDLGAEAQALSLDELAISQLEESSRLEPHYDTTFARLGQLHLERGDMARAAASYERYRAARPRESLGYLGLGRVALARGDAEEAEALLREAVRCTPNDAWARRALARALAAGGDLEASRREAASADRLPQYAGWLSFDERLLESHKLANTQRYLEGQGDLAAQRGDDERLIEVLSALVARRPDDVGSIANLAAACRGAGRLEEAETTVNRGLALAPESPALLCVRAEIAFTRRAYAEAQVALEHALAVDPEFARAYDLLGRTLHLQGRPDEAIRAMERSAALDPGSTKVRLALAVMLRQAGRRLEAEAVLTGLLRDDPENPSARQQLELLRADGP